MILQILIGVALLACAIVAYASTKPDSFRIERSIRIAAAPSKVFSHIDDLHRWTEWSPWENIDPEMKRTHGAVPSGKGATYSWAGNKNIGSGQMEIVESTPSSRVVIKLDFLTPFEAHNTAEFTLVPDGEGTTLTWAMFGPQPLMSKVMGIFMSMEKMIGGSFESGLAKLKSIAEAQG